MDMSRLSTDDEGIAKNTLWVTDRRGNKLSNFQAELLAERIGDFVVYCTPDSKVSPWDETLMQMLAQSVKLLLVVGAKFKLTSRHLQNRLTSCLQRTSPLPVQGPPSCQHCCYLWFMTVNAYFRRHCWSLLWVRQEAAVGTCILHIPLFQPLVRRIWHQC